MSGHVGEALNILREDGPIILTDRVLAKIYRTTLRRLMPQVGHFNINGVAVPGRRLFDGLTPSDWWCFPGNMSDYEHTEVEGVKQYVGGNNDVVVIGGGFGVTAVHAANNTSGEITVIEASKQRFQNLSKTFEANGVSDQIQSLFGYLGDLHIDLDDSDIPMIAYQDVPKADIWDMDCEGAEIEILQNLPYNPSTILIETHENHDEVIRLLEGLDYRIMEVVDDGVGQSPMCTHIRAIAN